MWKVEINIPILGNPFLCYSDTNINDFESRSLNALAELFNAKLKAFRADFRGVTDMKFFLFRVAKLYA
jgi:hypothetical protein